MYAAQSQELEKQNARDKFPPEAHGPVGKLDSRQGHRVTGRVGDWGWKVDFKLRPGSSQPGETLKQDSRQRE